jgi:hypothetical protein
MSLGQQSGQTRITRVRREEQRMNDTANEPRHEFTRGLYGQITHTDLASADPEATRT